MGNHSVKFKANLKKLARDYKTVVEYSHEYIPFNDAEYMDSLIKKYIHFYETYIKYHGDEIKSTNTDIEAIRTIHRIHPILYQKRETVKPEWLYAACVRQNEFYKKIYPLLSKYNYSEWKQKYKLFLQMCTKNPTKIIVPSLIEDFIWHAHMQDNLKYIQDTTKIYGQVLDHRDDYNEKDMQNFITETKTIREKNLDKPITECKAKPEKKKHQIKNKAPVKNKNRIHNTHQNGYNKSTPAKKSNNTKHHASRPNDDIIYTAYAPIYFNTAADDGYNNSHHDSGHHSNCDTGGHHSSCGGATSSCGGGASSCGAASSCGGGASSCGGGGGGCD